jgi:hypothetical protein
MPVTKMA